MEIASTFATTTPLGPPRPPQRQRFSLEIPYDALLQEIEEAIAHALLTGNVEEQNASPFDLHQLGPKSRSNSGFSAVTYPA